MNENKFGLSSLAIYNMRLLANKHKNSFSRNRVYWLSQLTGWVSLGTINLIILSLVKELSWAYVLLTFYMLFSGICITHIYRYIIKKYNWITLPIGKSVLYVLTSSFLIGVVLYGIYLTVTFFTSQFKSENFTTATAFISIINFTSLVLVWSLIYFAVHYFENFKRVEIESYIWEAAVKDHELKTLKSQLNPHFMFNAMNSIRALIEVEPKNAQVALTKLSNILRYSLKMEKNETVALGDEMQIVYDYLDLESIRFEERLRYNVEIDPRSLNVNIPPMMIQTIVENAIKHGVSRMTEGGELIIKTTFENDKLHIVIRNTGHLDLNKLKTSEGFGINSTKQRLNLLYGENALFLLKNENESTVVAEIIINTGDTKK
ncbi:MAG TPA: histidine kinase [Ignavibacteriaceae bacterium]|nr:histidine kinase [Ignavibacteriaceae bacterium]